MDDVLAVVVEHGFRRRFPAGIAIVPLVRNVLDLDNAEIASIVENFSDPFRL